MKSQSRYARIIEAIFHAHYSKGTAEFEFERQEIEEHARALGVKLPKNIGDLVYSFRYRADLPDSVKACAPEGSEWVILPAGRGRYRFALSATGAHIVPNPMLSETKIPDATPGVIAMYALSDEQALLAKVRYNRLIDVFTGTACYSLQSHLRTTVSGAGQVETDEIYVGLDQRGVHYVFPVQAKGGTDRLSVVQISQDMAMCSQKFPRLVCRPIATQFIEGSLIALFEFEDAEGEVRIACEKHYRLVAPEELTGADLERYLNVRASPG